MGSFKLISLSKCLVQERRTAGASSKTTMGGHHRGGHQGAEIWRTWTSRRLVCCKDSSPCAEEVSVFMNCMTLTHSQHRDRTTSRSPL